MAGIKDFRLSSCPKHYTLDQDKAVKPSQTVKRAVQRLSGMFDLSSVRIERRHDAVGGAYSFSSLSDQLQASGKGMTPDQSRASAIMEFAERYSWLHYDYKKAEGYTIGTYDEIKALGVPTVDAGYFFNTFIDLDQDQKQQLFNELQGIPLKWVKGVSLTDHREFYYPLNWHNYVFTSNGLATGNALEEAILQALCEVIERENIFRFLHERRAGNDLDQRSIENPLILRVLENARAAGIQFVIKDISLDFGVPTFIVLGTDPAQKGTLIHQGVGQGAHPHPEKALMRALSEYFESYSLLRDRLSGFDLDWEKILPRMEKRHFGFSLFYNLDMFQKRRKVVRLKRMLDLSRRDIRDEVENIVRILKKQGHNVIFVDKTHPGLGMPVPRVFVPTFRNLIGTDVRSPYFFLSEAAHEAGQKAAAEEFYRRSLLKTAFHLPQLSGKGKLDLIFKKDYRETLLSFGGLKKDAANVIKDLERALRTCR